MLKKLSRKKKGQGTLEYVLLLATFIIVIVVFIRGEFRTNLEKTYNGSSNMMSEMSTKLRASFGFSTNNE